MLVDLERMAVSSAKRLISVFEVCGMSLIKMLKRIGPRTDPWGVPAKIGLGVEK